MPDRRLLHGGGWFTDPDGNFQPFVLESTNGVFGNAVAVFTVDDKISQEIAGITAISCAKPGHCTIALSRPAALGEGLVDEAFLATKTNGEWSPLMEPIGFEANSGNLPTRINSLSCWRPDGCIAVGLHRRRGLPRRSIQSASICRRLDQ